MMAQNGSTFLTTHSLRTISGAFCDLSHTAVIHCFLIFIPFVASLHLGALSGIGFLDDWDLFSVDSPSSTVSGASPLELMISFPLLQRSTVFPSLAHWSYKQKLARNLSLREKYGVKRAGISYHARFIVSSRMLVSFGMRLSPTFPSRPYVREQAQG